MSSPAPETDGESGGQKIGEEVETGNPGGDDEVLVESIWPGGHDGRVD